MFKKRRLDACLKDSKGATIVEFALILPIFLVFIFAILDVSIYFFTSAQLQQALSDAARTIRTGTLVGKNTAGVTVTQDKFRQTLCDHIIPIMGMNCLADMRVDVRPYNSFDPAVLSGAMTSPDANTDGTISNNETSFDTGGASCAIVARVYFKYSPILPIGKLMNGIAGANTQPIPKESYLMAATAFRNEPFIGGTGPACTFY